MGLLDMCCPKKPKKSLDYIIKWVEDADKRFKDIDTYLEDLNTAINGDDGLNDRVTDLEDWKSTIDSTISDLVHDAIEEYPWSTLPDEALSRKADKVESAVAGHLASLDANGNIVDSGKRTGDFVPYVSEGSLEIEVEEFITLLSGDVDHQYANIEINGDGEQENPKITIDIAVPDATQPISKSAVIDTNNIDNLNRALDDPDTTPRQGSNSLITSGGVYNFKPSCIEDVEEGQQHAKVYVDSQTQGGPNIIIELNDSNTPGSTVTKYATISIGNIDNLNLALKGPDTTPTSGSDSLITSGGVYSQLEDIRQSLTHRIETIEELFNSLNERVSNLENPQYSDTGIVITNDRYNNKTTTNTTVYNELQIGGQAKVEIEYQDGLYSDTLYVTVIDKRSGPPQTVFDKDIYGTNVTGVTLYKRIS